MKFLILALFITLGCDTALAQTTVTANVLQGSPSFVDSTPRPTFNFSLAPNYRGFTSALITWGTGSTKDGILIKIVDFNKYGITDISKTGNVVVSDSRNDIYGASYSPTDGRLSFTRSWDTGDSSNDVPFKRSEPNSFQWEIHGYDTSLRNTLYVGSCSCTFVQVKAFLENQGPDGPVGFLGMENQNLFSNWTVRTVLTTKPQIENFAENFVF